jgi:hypothetical protein
MNSIIAGSAALITTITLGIAPASADYCAEFEMPAEHDGNNIILVGESTGQPLFGGSIVLGRNMAAVCWMDGGGGWHFKEFPDCTTSTPAGNRLRIAAGAGDDLVMPVVRQDPRLDFICPASPRRERMYPFYSYPGDVLGGEGCRDPDGCSLFQFGLKVEGGPGVDALHGSPNSDRLEGNVVHDLCLPIGHGACIAWTPVADRASDSLCGYNGDDALYGDEAGARQWAECFDGGAGVDHCDGFDDDYDDAVAGSCESVDGAAEVTSYFVGPPAGDCCSADDGPGCAPAYAQRDVQSCVCDADPYCCSTAWDDLCAREVESLGCGSCDGWLVQPEACSRCGIEVRDCTYDQTYVIPPMLDLLKMWLPALSPELYLAPQTRGYLDCGP